MSEINILLVEDFDTLQSFLTELLKKHEQFQDSLAMDFHQRQAECSKVK
jgi:hypothetical protein